MKPDYVKEKVNETTKLVDSGEPECTASGEGDVPLSQPEDGKDVETVVSTRPASDTSSKRHTKCGPALRRHQTIVGAVISTLCLLGVGMGVSIFMGNATSTMIDRGFQLLSQGKESDALSVLEKVGTEKVSYRYRSSSHEIGDAAALLDASSYAYSTRAAALASQSKKKEAEVFYSLAYGLNFDDHLKYASNGSFYLNTYQQQAIEYARLLKERGRTREAIQTLRYASAMFEGSTELKKLSESLGDTKVSYFDSKALDGYERALRDTYTVNYDKLLRLKDSDEPAYEETKRQAIKAIDDQIRKAPSFAPGWLARAILIYREEPDSAINDLSHVLSLYPGLPQALALRAEAYEVAGRKNLALNDYDEALRAVPDSFYLLNRKANLLQSMGSLNDAKNVVAGVLKLRPADTSSRLLASRLLAAMGDDAAALSELKRAEIYTSLKKLAGIYSVTELADICVEKAKLLLKLKRFEEASKALDHAPYQSTDEVTELRKEIEKVREAK